MRVCPQANPIRINPDCRCGRSFSDGSRHLAWIATGRRGITDYRMVPTRVDYRRPVCNVLWQGYETDGQRHVERFELCDILG